MIQFSGTSLRKNPKMSINIQRQTAILTIDCAALYHNINMLRSAAPGAACAGVVKADAYGLGIGGTLPVFQAAGIKTYFVATLDEAIHLRGLLGRGPVIYVLSGLYRGAEADYVRHDVRPVLNALDELSRCPDDLPAALHFDTGMRRLGLDTLETQKLMDDPSMLQGKKIAVIMSHFACADEPDHPLTREQYLKFNAIKTLCPGAALSLSNSAGIFASSEYHFDLVRPGMAVYGLNPTTGPNPMKPVVGLKARILQVRKALRGETVGYGATWTAPQDVRVATLALGYADGVLRSLSGRGVVHYNKVALPVIGRVSMDMITIDATSAPALAAGDWVDVLGPEQDADALARDAGTIGYEILTSLGARYHRDYVNAS